MVVRIDGVEKKGPRAVSFLLSYKNTVSRTVVSAVTKHSLFMFGYKLRSHSVGMYRYLKYFHISVVLLLTIMMSSVGVPNSRH